MMMTNKECFGYIPLKKITKGKNMAQTGESKNAVWYTIDTVVNNDW